MDRQITLLSLVFGVITALCSTPLWSKPAFTASTVTTSLNAPSGVVGNNIGSAATVLYAADTNNHRITATVIATGATSVLAGSGAAGWADGDGTNARFNHPTGIAIDNTNTFLYVADSDNGAIRKISLSSPYAVTTLIGKSCSSSYGTSGGCDNQELIPGAGTNASFINPYGLVISYASPMSASFGGLWVTDSTKGFVSSVDLSRSPAQMSATAAIDPYGSVYGFGPSWGGIGNGTKITGITMDGASPPNILVSASDVNQIWSCTPGGTPTALASCTAIAGTGDYWEYYDDNYDYYDVGYWVDEMIGSPQTASFWGPTGLAYDRARSILYVSDNNIIRAIDFISGSANNVNTVSGGATKYCLSCFVDSMLAAGYGYTIPPDPSKNTYYSNTGFTNGTGSNSSFNTPAGLFIDQSTANLYIADQGNNAIRKLNVLATSATSYTLTGPRGGALNAGSTLFTVTPNDTYTGTITITPSGGGLSTPIVKTFSNSATAQTFTITPTAVGPVTLTPTNNGSLTNPAALTYATPPGAPTIGTATAGNTQASVTFTAPSSDGGLGITVYTVISNPGGITVNGGSSPITVTGLTNGTQYKFTVTATNAAGLGSSSSATSYVTPKATQTITFANPGTQNFGTTPTLSATATSSLAPTFSSSTTGVCTITSGGLLAFVTTGTCTIDANQAGNGSYLAATTVTQSFTVAAVVPGAPTIGTATRGDGQASVTFTAPSFNGGSAITGYTVTSNPAGGTDSNAASTSLSHVVTGLTNGTAYTFSVTATNTIGTGSPSGSSNSVTPAPIPTVNLNSASRSISATTVTITGTGFDTTAANNTVTFNLGAVGTVTAATSNQLTVTFTTQPTSIGSLTATVTTNGQSSGSAVQVATAVAAPTVTSSASNLALNAATLIIAGSGFDTIAANNTVTLNNGATGTVTAATSTQLTVTFTSPPTSTGSLTAVVASFGGISGSPVQVATAVLAPVDCVVSPWSAYGACSASCGGGTQTQTRTIVTPASNGGAACPALTQSQSCNTQPCPVDCAVSAWSACSASCGGGTQTRTVTTAAAYGGAACPTLSQSCNTQACPTVTSSTSSRSISATTVTITGTGFDTTAANNTVTFNLGAVGTVTAATSNQLTVTFTTQPTSIGSLTATVTTNGQSSGSAVQVATAVAAPTVTSSASNLALNAATLIIAGSGFDTIAANNTVTLNNGATGTVTAATSTQLTVTFTSPPTSTGSLTAVVASFGGISGSPVQVATAVLAPVDCVVSPWSAYGACSASCGGGTQTQTRTIVTPASNGGAACPALSQSQSCNVQACNIPALSISNSPQTYTGSPIAATVTCSGGGAVGNLLYGGSSSPPTNAGTYSVTGDCAANGNYSAVTGALAGSFVISPATQTITAIATPSSINVNGTASLSSSGSSGSGAITFTQVSGPCTVSGTTLTGTGAGTCVLTASIAADNNYSQVTSNPLSIGVGLATQAALVVTATPSNISINATSTLSTTGGSGLGAVTYSLVSGPCTLNGTALTGTGAGSCIVTATKAADSAYAATTSAQVAVAVSLPSVSGTTPGGTVIANLTGGSFVSGSGQFMAPSNPPAGQSLPYGVFSFTATTTVGGSITLTLTYPQALAAGTKVWKDLTGNGSWVDWTSNVTISGNTITYTIADGGNGDADGAVNGSVTDPLGPSSPATIPTPSPTPIPTLSEWARIMLVFMMIMMMHWYGRRMKQR